MKLRPGWTALTIALAPASAGLSESRFVTSALTNSTFAGASNLWRARSASRVNSRTRVAGIPASRRTIARPIKPEPPATATVFSSMALCPLRSEKGEGEVQLIQTSDSSGARFAALFRAGRFAALRQCDQAEVRNLGAAVDSNPQQERAEAAIGVDIEIAVTVESRVESLADLEHRPYRRAVERYSHDAAVRVAGEHHSRLEVARVERSVRIMREHDRAITRCDVAERARWLGAARPEVIDSHYDERIAAQSQPMAFVREDMRTGSAQRFGDYAERRPMVVIPGNRKRAGRRVESGEHAPKLANVAPHRLRPREIVAGEKYEIRMLPVDLLNGLLETVQVLVAVDMEVADLARHDALERRGQASHWQRHSHDFDLVYCPPPHPMERTQRNRRLALAPLTARRPIRFDEFLRDGGNRGSVHQDVQSRTLPVDGGSQGVSSAARPKAPAPRVPAPRYAGAGCKRLADLP